MTITYIPFMLTLGAVAFFAFFSGLSIATFPNFIAPLILITIIDFYAYTVYRHFINHIHNQRMLQEFNTAIEKTSKEN